MFKDLLNKKCTVTVVFSAHMIDSGSIPQKIDGIIVRDEKDYIEIIENVKNKKITHRIEKRYISMVSIIE